MIMRSLALEEWREGRWQLIGIEYFLDYLV
jgi:hypothetical protein